MKIVLVSFILCLASVTTAFQYTMFKDPVNSDDDKPVWDVEQPRSIQARANMDEDDDKPVDIVESQTPISVGMRFLIDAPPGCPPGQRMSRKGCRTISYEK